MAQESESVFDHRQPVKVLVVDDSPTGLELLVWILRQNPGIQVVGTARNGAEAIEFIVNRAKPDVIAMDLHMPVLDGIETTRRIMETTPIPIVIVSATLEPTETAESFRAVEAGALTVLQRPLGPGNPGHERKAQELVHTLLLMSEVKLVRRLPHLRRDPQAVEIARDVVQTAETARYTPVRVVAIGASTGGPVVLQKILQALPRSLGASILVVNHMAHGFIAGFAEWLENMSGLPVHIAADGETLLPGHVYLAPDDAHMGVRNGGVIALSHGEPEQRQRPSVSHLFRSVAEIYGSRAAGVLLTGMGKDGADALKLLRDRGAVTVVQDRASAVVYGMPGEALRLEAARFVLAPEAIAALLETLAAGGVAR